MDEIEKKFFANFQILGPLGCQGWVVIPQNVKKVKITAPYPALLEEKDDNIKYVSKSGSQTEKNAVVSCSARDVRGPA
jgi:hypothetical protein